MFAVVWVNDKVPEKSLFGETCTSYFTAPLVAFHPRTGLSGFDAPAAGVVIAGAAGAALAGEIGPSGVSSAAKSPAMTTDANLRMNFPCQTATFDKCAAGR